MMFNNYELPESITMEYQLKKDLSLDEKYEKLQAKIKLLQAENELLKKLEIL